MIYLHELESVDGLHYDRSDTRRDIIHLIDDDNYVRLVKAPETKEDLDKAIAKFGENFVMNLMKQHENCYNNELGLKMFNELLVLHMMNN